MTAAMVLGTASALALTGCGSSSGSGGALGAGTSAAKGSTSAAASGGAASGKTINIGFEGPLSGANAQLGINEVNGATLAVQQANESGKLGFKVALVKADDQGDPAK